MVIRKCVNLNCQKKDLILRWVLSQAIFELTVMKGKALLPCLLVTCLVPMLVYPNMVLNNINQHILSTSKGDWNGAVPNTFHSVNLTWEIGSPLTGGARWMKLACVARFGHIHLTHHYNVKKDPPPQCEHCQRILTVRHILAECSHLAQIRNVVESFRLHLTLALTFLNVSFILFLN